MEVSAPLALNSDLRVFQAFKHRFCRSFCAWIHLIAKRWMNEEE